jgi:hypothetical protein
LRITSSYPDLAAYFRCLRAAIRDSGEHGRLKVTPISNMGKNLDSFASNPNGTFASVSLASIDEDSTLPSLYRFGTSGTKMA